MNKVCRILFYTACILLVVLRIRLIYIPFDRNEGEIAYMAQLILGGHSPWEVYTVKIPGVSFIYAFFMWIGGQNVLAVRTALLIFNLMTIFFLYKLFSKYFSGILAAVAVLVFVILCCSAEMSGNTADNSQFALFFIAGACWFLLKATDIWRAKDFFLAGIFFGLAVIMEENMVLFCVFAVVFILFQFYSAKQLSYRLLFFNLLKIMAGMLIPFLIITIVALLYGDLNTFWKNNDLFNGKLFLFFSDKNRPEHIFPVLLEAIGKFRLLWLISGFGFLSFLFSKHFLKGKKPFISLFLVFSLAALPAADYSGKHHLMVLIPVVCFFFAWVFETVFETIRKYPVKNIYIHLPLVFFCSLLIYFLYIERQYFFLQSPDEITKELQPADPFSESVEVSAFIAANSSSEDKIAILGSEPEILFYAKRKSAIPFINITPLVNGEKGNMALQLEMINKMEAEPPLFIVFSDIPLSWNVKIVAPAYILTWFSIFSKQYYRLVGIADILPNGSVIKWNKELTEYQPVSPYRLLVYKRKV